MPELRFRLADGEEVSTSLDADLFNALWLLADRRGAISAAGKVQHARTFIPSVPSVIDLDEHESERMKEALERISETRSRS